MTAIQPNSHPITAKIGILLFAQISFGDYPDAKRWELKIIQWQEMSLLASAAKRNIPSLTGLSTHVTVLPNHSLYIFPPPDKVCYITGKYYPPIAEIL